MNYHYTPLDIKKHEIRVLDLYPGVKSDPLRCHLRTCSLVDNVGYEALSYTWGNPLPRYYITSDSSCISISPALHVALCHLRYSSGIRTLWIDALCINQEDLQEREEQVGQMRSVYVSAMRVLVCLGEEGQDSEAVMSLLADIDVTNRKDLQGEIRSRVLSKWDAISDLLRRSWWERVWIIQEMSVGSSEPIVGCGDQWVPWSKFEALDDILGELEETGAKTAVENPISKLAIIRAGTQGRLKTNWKNLFMLLRATRECQATDSRDKVYALLGLSSKLDQAAIIPSYTKSVVDVFTTVAIHIIRTEESLNILMYDKPSRIPGLPSWVPDFSISGELRTHIGDPPGKGASRKSKPIVEFLSGSRMKVRGWIVDQVREVSQVDYHPQNPSNSISEFEILAGKTTKNIPPTKDEEIALEEAFWRCLVADRTLNYEFPAPASYEHYYSVFRDKAPVPADFESDLLDGELRKEDYLHQFTSGMLSTLYLARFFITRDGRLGVGPVDTQQDDSVVILQGADIPFIVRKSGVDGIYAILREAYVSGMMYGEMFEGENKLSFGDGFQSLVIC